MKIVRLVGMALPIALLVGCASSRVRFVEPEGAKLWLTPNGTPTEKKEYVFPVEIDLPQTDEPEDLQRDVGGKPIRLTLSDGTKFKGFLYVYELNMDQVEKLAEVTFQLTDEQIVRLKNGYAVSVFGYSARKRPVYKVNLGLER